MTRLMIAVVACCLHAGAEAGAQVWTDEPAIDREEWKAPEATPEDYAESERYWHGLKERLDRKEELDRTDAGLKPVDGRGTRPRRTEKASSAHGSRAETPAPVRPIRAVVVKPDGTIIIIFRDRP